MGATGGAYDAEGFSGFSLAGAGLTVDASNDFGPGDISGLVAGQTYSLSYTVGSEYFNGHYGGTSITGNGSITWQFTVIVPNDPGGQITLEVPGMVAGNFNFCAPGTYQESSACGADDNPLGNVTFTGIGTDLIDLNCTVSGTCSIYADYLEPYTATADMNVVPEPSTLALMAIASLFAYPALRFGRRRNLASAEMDKAGTEASVTG
jgi:hypothetical protein